ncbi:hypothetical protein D3C80_1211360 [compost metagenome]
MDHAAGALQAHRHAGGQQALGEGLALVAQRVELGAEQGGRRQLRQIGGEQRRGQRLLGLLRALQVLRAEPLHHRPAEEVAVGEGGVGGAGTAQVGDRVEQALVGDARAALLRGLAAGGDGQVGPGAVAGHGQASGVDLQFGAAPGQIVQGVEGVQRGGRVARFGRAAVVHRHHRRTAEQGQAAAQLVMAVEVAEDEAAAVEEHHERQAGLRLRPVQARRQRAGGTGDAQLAHLGQGCRRAQRRHGAGLAHGGGVQAGKVGGRLGGHLREQGGDLRVKRHGSLLAGRRGRTAGCVPPAPTPDGRVAPA